MTPEELYQIAEDEQEKRKQYVHHLYVCTAAGCLSSHGDSVLEALKKEVKEAELEEECLCKGVGCMGLCAEGPLVLCGTGRRAVWQSHEQGRQRDYWQFGERTC